MNTNKIISKFKLKRGNKYPWINFGDFLFEILPTFGDL